jgi:flagellar hook-basal body complex protein FliE
MKPDSGNGFGPSVGVTLEEGCAVEPQKKKIKAREFVKDLRSGMDDIALAEKYSINRDQFHKLLRMAVDSGLISSDELHSRISHSRTAITRAFVEMQKAVRELSTVTAVIDKVTE